MEQSTPWETGSRPKSQEILCLSWNLNMNCHNYKIQPVDSIQSQLNSVYILTSYLFKISLNIILIFILRFNKGSLPFRFSD
jgi:hypothetical protein